MLASQRHLDLAFVAMPLLHFRAYPHGDYHGPNCLEQKPTVLHTWWHALFKTLYLSQRSAVAIVSIQSRKTWVPSVESCESNRVSQSVNFEILYVTTTATSTTLRLQLCLRLGRSWVINQHLPQQLEPHRQPATHKNSVDRSIDQRFLALTLHFRTSACLQRSSRLPN